MKLQRTIPLLLLFFIGLVATAQKNTLQRSLYFESGSYALQSQNLIVLQGLLDSLKNYQAFTIQLKGYTDNVGDSAYNMSLSQKRVEMSRAFFISNGIDTGKIITAAFGQNKPLADNLSEEGKQKNRRVDILIKYKRKPIIDSSLLLPSIKELYKKIERKPQEFLIQSDRDTVIRGQMGTVLYIKANSFKGIPANASEIVTIKLKEAYLLSEMIQDNLITTSNNRLLETQGMISIEAFTAKGKQTDLQAGKNITVFMPTDTVRTDVKIFNSRAPEHDGGMNWIINNNNALSSFSLADLNTCAAHLSGGSGNDCNLFFCKIRKAIRSVFKRKPSNATNGLPMLSKNLIPTCKQLQELYLKYGVKNLNDLALAINKPLLDSFGVKTIEALRDTLAKVNLKRIELAYQNGSISYNDLKYYVFNTSKLGFINIDAFAKLNPGNLVDLTIRFTPERNTECKIVFIKRRGILPGGNLGKYYVFNKIPKNEMVYIVAIKYLNGQALLAIEEIKTAQKTIELNFQTYTLEELKEQLKKLDDKE